MSNKKCSTPKIMLDRQGIISWQERQKVSVFFSILQPGRAGFKFLRKILFAYDVGVHLSAWPNWTPEKLPIFCKVPETVFYLNRLDIKNEPIISSEIFRGIPPLETANKLDAILLHLSFYYKSFQKYWTISWSITRCW